MSLDIEELSEESNDALYEHYSFKVDPGQGFLRIDKYLQVRIENASRTKIQLAAEAGSIRVNGASVKPNYKVKPGDDIRIMMEYPKRDITVVPEDIELNIVFEDDYVLVVNKPAGMVVHPSYGHYNGTLVNALAYHLRDLPMFKGNDPRPGLIHRIDKNTSGLLVIAKTEDAKNHLARQFFDHTTERRYQAVAWGSFDDMEGTITGHIGRNFKNRKVMDVFPDGAYGKHAITHYKVLEHLGYVSLLELRLETGRTHQIRAHMKFVGHPLFNDEEYGGEQILKGTTFTKYKQFVTNCFKILPRQALHAKTLGFVHPKSGEFMRFNSELPDEMTILIDKWRNYIANRKEE